MITTTVARLAVVLASALQPALPPRDGFALQTGAARVVAHFTATAVPGRPLTDAFDFWATRRGDPKPLADYDVEMTKRLHIVIVRDDFTTFGHVHATSVVGGHFMATYRFPRPGFYHVYADMVPHGAGQQVFRWTVSVGANPRSSGAPVLGAPNAVSHAGPYTVRLDRTALVAGGETMVKIGVSENGAPARDLRPYLGAPAHAVFLNARDLTYVHVHPLDPRAASGTSGMAGMGAMSMPMTEAPLAPDTHLGSAMLLHVAVREPGRYKLWLQFRGGGALRVATFVLDAR